MDTITTSELDHITGGVSARDATLSQHLTSLNTSVKTLAQNQGGSSCGLNTSTMMMLALVMRSQQPAVVPGAAYSPGPIINIRTRVRRW